MQKSFKTRDGIMISYHLWNGTRSRRWMVFIHGLGSNLTVWEPVLRKSKNNGINLVALDLRGHGHSARPKGRESYRFHHNAEDLIDLLNELKVRKAVVVGHSSGALIALDAAHRFPKRVESLVLLGPNHGDLFEHYSTLSRALKTSFKGTCTFLAHLAERIPRRRLTYPNYGMMSSSLGLHTFYKDILGNELDTYLWNLLAYLDESKTKALKTIKTPTLIVHGTDDKVVNIKGAREMKRKLPKARLIELKGAKHQLMFDNREEIIEILDRFMRGLK